MGDGAVPCSQCGHPDTELWARAHDVEYFVDERLYEYRHCANCDVLFLRDPPVERLREIYPETYYSLGDSVGAKRGVGDRVKESLDRREFRRLLARLPGDQLRVLDVGGGSGWLLTLVREASERVVETHEVDLDPSARQAAQDAGHVFHETTIERFAGAEPFDLVVMLNLIEHVPDPGAVLDQVRTMLRPEGRVLIKTPNIDTVDARLFRRTYWGGLHCPRHFVLFDPGSLSRLAHAHGFRVDRLGYTQGAHQWTASTLATLHQRHLIRLSAGRPLHTHPLYRLLNPFFAAIDFARLPFAPTAQMMCELTPA